MKATHPLSLNVIQVRNPCPADWDEMVGDERVRFCGECKLHVYNLSALSRAAAEELITMHTGRLCIRYFQRPDGTILTQDCSWIRRAARRTAMAVASFALAAMFWIGGCGDSERIEPSTTNPTTTPNTKPQNNRVITGATVGILEFKPTSCPKNVALMGAVAYHDPRPATQPADSSGSR